MSSNAAISAERIALLRRGTMLEYATIVWNSLEALISIGAGLVAGSVALVGFGLDSVIETSAGLALLWRLHHSNELTAIKRERAERISMSVVGWSFVALGIYILWDSASALWKHEAPEESIVGIVIAALSMLAMPLLARMKRNVATSLNSAALKAESKQTELCAYLSVILLAGLLLNALLGWWWVDSVAALAMTPIIFAEGVKALHGETCDCHATTSVPAGECCSESGEGRCS